MARTKLYVIQGNRNSPIPSQAFLVNVNFPKMKPDTNTWGSQGCFCCGPTMCQIWPTCWVQLWACMEWVQPQDHMGALACIYVGLQVTFLEDWSSLEFWFSSFSVPRISQCCHKCKFWALVQRRLPTATGGSESSICI